MVNWQRVVDELNAGNSVTFKPKGTSMQPRINSGERVTASPDISDIVEGDVVVCKIKGNYYCHIVKKVGDGKYLISNNRGKVNGWTSNVYGKVVEIGYE